jgi:acyl carrier protein
VEGVALLRQGGEAQAVRGLRAALEKRRAAALRPEDFWDLGDEVAYAVDVTWSKTGGAGYCDVLFRRRLCKAETTGDRLPPPFWDEPIRPKPWTSYANNPLQVKVRRTLPVALRAFLERKLPSSMVPSVFVLLDEIPLTPAGKTDRRALPVPDCARPELDHPFVAPRTPLEERVAAIWSEVLGVAPVGLHDNFFELGGHSLLATRVISRVRNAFGVELPLPALFETPTIAGLALVIVQHLAARAEPGELAAIWKEIRGPSGPASERPLPC